jgi:hypothetical protein
MVVRGVLATALGVGHHLLYRATYTQLLSWFGYGGLLLLFVAFAVAMGLAALPLRSYATALLVSSCGWAGMFGCSLIIDRTMTLDRTQIVARLASLFLLWLPILTLLLALTWLHHRWRPIFAPGQCRRCGYDLHGLTSRRCPECGTANSIEAADTAKATSADQGRESTVDAHNDGPGSLSADIDRLRKRLRRMELVAAGLVFSLLAMGAGLFWLGRSNFNSVSTGNLWAWRGNGTWGAFLGQYSDGRFSLSLTDTAGVIRAALTTFGAGQPALVLNDTAGIGRMELFVDDNEGPKLWLLDSNGNPQVGFTGIDQDRPGLSIWDDKGRERTVLRMQKDAIGLLLLDEGGNTSLSAYVDSNGIPSFRLNDADGTMRLALRGGPLNQAGLVARDEDGVERLIMGWRDGRFGMLAPAISTNGVSPQGGQPAP